MEIWGAVYRFAPRVCAARGGGQVDTSWCYTSEYRATGVYDRVKYTTLYSVYKRTGDPRSWTPAKKNKKKQKKNIFFINNIINITAD